MDINGELLRIAQRNIPSGVFIKSSVDDVILDHESVDLILSFGLLMYMEAPMKTLKRLMCFLKSDGFLAIHEPIRRKNALSRIPFLARFSRDCYKLRASGIEEKELFDALAEYGNVIDCHREYSALRTWVTMLFEKQMELSPAFTRFVLALDQLCIKTLGRFIEPLGAGAVLVLFQKAKRR